VRVPMIMVSPYIKKNTIVNECMSHTSFLRTMHKKCGLTSLSTREDASPCFDVPGLLWPTLQRSMSEMRMFDVQAVPQDRTDYSKAMLPPLAKAVISSIAEALRQAYPEHPTMEIKTQGHAAAFLRDAIPMAKSKLGLAEEAQIKDRDWMPLFKAIAREMKRKGRPR
jgi:phospholipase C